jgi:hypothetical protein
MKTTPQIRGLRPKEIKARFGIPPSTLHFFCTELPEAERLPSLLLPSRGRTRRNGVRIIYEHELLHWLEKHRQKKTG